MADEDGYLRGWRERWRVQHEQAALAAQRARRVADRLAELLRDRYGVHRVILVGSLARNEFARDSDIDLAVEGLAPSELFRAGAELERAAEGFAVDLVPLESASAAYRAAVEREGIELHDARAA